MCKSLLFMLTAMGVAVTPAIAQIQQRAQIVGGGNNTGGRCTVEVVVDGTADVEIRADMANLRDISGQEPQFRRFECTGIMPPNPVNFQFRSLAGRGSQRLMRDPRNGGTAEVRIEDPEAGADTYVFEIQWSNGGDFGPGPGQGRFSDRERFMQTFDATRVMHQCQDAVRREAAERYNAMDLAFPEARIDDDHDWVRGRIEVTRGPGRQGQYQFACALNRDTGQVRSVRIDPVQGGMNPGAAAPVTGRAMQNCRRAVAERLRNDGYGRVEFGTMNLDARPGRGDWIQGSVKGIHADTSDFFNFSCSVDLRDGDVRSVDVTRR